MSASQGYTQLLSLSAKSSGSAEDSWRLLKILPMAAEKVTLHFNRHHLLKKTHPSTWFLSVVEKREDTHTGTGSHRRRFPREVAELGNYFCYSSPNMGKNLM